MSRSLLFFYVILLYLFFGPGIDEGKGNEDIRDDVSKMKLKLIATLNPWSKALSAKTYPVAFPQVYIVTLSPDGQWLAWADEHGNIFLAHTRDRKILVAYDHTVTEPPYSISFDIDHEKANNFIKEHYGIDVLEILTPPSNSEKKDINSVKIPNMTADQCICFMKTLEKIHHNYDYPETLMVDDKQLIWIDYEDILWYSYIIDKNISPSWQLKAEFIRGSCSGIFYNDRLIVCQQRKRSFLRDFWSGEEHNLKEYDFKTGRLLRTCQYYPADGNGFHDVHLYALSSDRKLLAIASMNNSGLVNMEDFKLVHTFNIGSAQNLSMSEDGSRIAIYSLAEGLVIVNGQKGNVIHKYEEKYNIITAIAFASNDLLWIAQLDNELYLVDYANDKAKLVLKNTSIKTMCYHQETGTLCLGGNDGSIKIYRLVPN